MPCPFHRVAAIAAAVVLGLSGATTLAQTPPAPPQTFWNWMGIPSQPFAGIRNRSGNFPEFERKPALKKIADPANLASDNAAIKKAAEIKAQEDMAAQKIKAIKYLAEIGCGGCYEGVDKALAEALGDCTEEVRYEAVKAVIAASSCGVDQCVRKCVRQTMTCKEAMCTCWVGCMKRTCATMHLLCGKAGPNGETLKSRLPGYGCGTGGNCQGSRCACGNGNCCTSEILNKLSEMAFEKDDRGCWKEPSPRVRAMARQALRACGPHVRPMTDADIPVPEEVPLPVEEVSADASRTPETPAEEKKPETPAEEKKPETPAEPKAPETPADDSKAQTPSDATPLELGRDEPTATEVADAESAAAIGFDGSSGIGPAVGDAEASPVATASDAANAPAPVATRATAMMVAVAIPVAPSPEDLFPQPHRVAPVDLRGHLVAPPAQPRSSGWGLPFFTR